MGILCYLSKLIQYRDSKGSESFPTSTAPVPALLMLPSKPSPSRFSLAQVVRSKGTSSQGQGCRQREV